jgi:hypothetical protein
MTGPIDLMMGDHPIDLMMGDHPIDLMMGDHPIDLMMGDHPIDLMMEDHPLNRVRLKKKCVKSYQQNMHFHICKIWLTINLFI